MQAKLPGYLCRAQFHFLTPEPTILFSSAQNQAEIHVARKKHQFAKHRACAALSNFLPDLQGITGLNILNAPMDSSSVPITHCIYIHEQQSGLIRDRQLQSGYPVRNSGQTIGEGTFGKVRLGVHIPTDSKVAVKTLQK